MERFKRTIKRIAAIAGGAVMVGATMAGALAALEDLPAPFVTTAGILDSYIVVGTLGWNSGVAYDSAAVSGLARDVATGIDVGAAFAQKASMAAGATSATSTVSEGVQIKSAGQDFNYANDIEDVDATYSDGDLDPVFKDGTYKESKGDTTNDVSYTQQLTFQDLTGTFTFAADDTQDTEPAGKYLLFNDGVDVYEYKANFPSGIDYKEGAEKDDFKGSKIDLQGKTYTFSNAENNPVTLLELLSGSLVATQGEYTTQTYTFGGNSYEIEVLIIADVPETVKFKVNGETTDAMAAGDTTEVAGIEIGVDEVLPNEGSEAAGADQATFYLGANKLTLEDGNEIKVNDKEMEDWTTDVQIDATDNGATGTLNFLTITAQPDDDHYLKVGDSLTDPVFGAWKVVFAGIEEKTEALSIKAAADKATLTFMNNANKKVELPFVYDETNHEVVFGDDYDKYTGLTDNGQAMLLQTGEACTGVAAPTECKNIDILVVSVGGEARVFKLTGISVADDTYDLKDMSTGKTYTDLEFGTAEDIGVISDFELGLAGNVVTATNINNYVIAGADNNCDAGAAEDCEIEFKTSDDALIGFDAITAVGTSVTSFFVDKDGDIMGSVNIEENTAADDVEVDKSGIAASDILDGFIAKEKDSDTMVGIDVADWGLYGVWDSEDKDTLDMTYPEDKVIADVWLAPSAATTTAATSGSVNINYINAATGIAKVDTDFAAAPTKNVILIGGPYVNKLVSDLAAEGKTWTAAEWDGKADTAIVKLVENAYGNYDALIIAGMDAKDTALAGKVVASKVLQNQFADKLKGTSVTIGTAGVSQVSEVVIS